MRLFQPILADCYLPCKYVLKQDHRNSQATSFNAYAMGSRLVVHGTGREPTLLVLDAATGKTLKKYTQDASAG